MKIKKIAILGAGNGGVTAAADMTAKGFEVNLFELPDFEENIKAIQDRGGIIFSEKNQETFVSPSLVTTDVEEAISDADVVMLVIPAMAIEKFARLCAPFLKEEQIVFINNAASMASVRFVNTVRSLGITTAFKIGETASLTYGTRVVDKVKVELYLRVKNLLFSAYPSSDSEELINLCRDMYPSLIRASNVWETTLNNGNPETHPGPSLLNAGRIEYSKGEFFLYTEGITESVIRVIKGIASERKLICEALNIQYLAPEKRLVNLGYCENYPTLQEQYNQSKVFSAIKGPLSLSSRYFTEDIAMGLVLWSSLGKELKITTPLIDSIITLGGALLQKDFWTEGLTVSKLNIPISQKL